MFFSRTPKNALSLPLWRFRESLYFLIDHHRSILCFLIFSCGVEQSGKSLADGSVPVEDSYVLIYQNRVSIRINDHKTSRAGRAFVDF